jgi:hypothetical protein
MDEVVPGWRLRYLDPHMDLEAVAQSLSGR